MQRTYVSSVVYKDNFRKVAIMRTSIAAKKKKHEGTTLTNINVSPASEVPTSDVSVLLMTGNLKKQRRRS